MYKKLTHPKAKTRKKKSRKKKDLSQETRKVNSTIPKKKHQIICMTKKRKKKNTLKFTPFRYRIYLNIIYLFI
jgi:hypothetical protein